MIGQKPVDPSVQQDREEMEVLFTLLADRYERSSVMLTSNLPFSKWEQIFKDPMTTAAATSRPPSSRCRSPKTKAIEGGICEPCGNRPSPKAPRNSLICSKYRVNL